MSDTLRHAIRAALAKLEEPNHLPERAEARQMLLDALEHREPSPAVKLFVAQEQRWLAEILSTRVAVMSDSEVLELLGQIAAFRRTGEWPA